MSLNPQSKFSIPAETARVAKAVFNKGNPYLILRDELGSIFDDADFSHLYSHTGQPGISPWQLALITLMQFRENLSDRQAAEAVRARIDWKYLLGLELTDTGFDFTVLTEFRNRLIAGNAENVLLEKLLQHSNKLGFVKERGKQRTDSTRVLASIRKLNRLELVAETVRATLNQLASIVPEWVAAIAPPEWYQRYGRRIEDDRLPRSLKERDLYGQLIGEDGYYLLDCLEKSQLPFQWQDLSSIKALKLTLERHYEYNAEHPDSLVRWKSKKELSKAKHKIESPYDIEARYRSRHEVNWVGYIVHLSETCEDDQCHLITHVMTTDATVHEAQCTEEIHQALIEKNLSPKEHFVDSAYVDAELLVKSQHEDIELVGPTRLNHSWQKKTEGGIDSSQFQIDWQRQHATCPMGKISISWREYVKSTGPYIRARFSQSDCQPCKLRSRCTKSQSKYGRTVAFKTQVEYEALENARAKHSSPEGQKRYQRRAGIEGTISQGVRGFGMRRSRYRGLAKTHLQNIAIGAAINLERLINWFQDMPLAKTRISRFKALKPI